MLGRPSETMTALVGAIVGALLIILGAFDVKLVEKITPEVAGAITFLVALVAAAVTALVAKRQRTGLAGSGADGTVTGG